MSEHNELDKTVWEYRWKRGLCLNCGEKGPHFVPPSLGDEGFYMCKRVDDDN